MFSTILSCNISNTRGQIQYPSLRQSTLHEHLDITVLIPDRFQSTRDAKTVKESSDGFVEVSTNFTVWDTCDRGVCYCGGIEDR